MTCKTNPLCELVERLQGHFDNDLVVDVSEPFHPTGIWIADLWIGNFHLVVQYSPDRGFGVSSGHDELSSKPDEIYADLDSASARVFELLMTRGNTLRQVSLSELRHPLTQSEFAQFVGMKQPTYSRLEKAPIQSMKLNTLLKIVEARGSVLHLVIQDKHGNMYHLSPEVSSKNAAASAAVARTPFGLTATGFVTGESAEQSWLRFKRRFLQTPQHL